MTLTNPPFMPQKGQPPFHLRPWTPDELAQAKRMRESYERLFQRVAVIEGK